MKFLQSVGAPLSATVRWLGQMVRLFFCALANGRRLLARRKWADYIVFELDGDLLERSLAQPWYYSFLPFASPPQTIEAIAAALRAVAADPDVRGILFLVRGAQLSLAQSQSLAALFDRFRVWDQAENGPGRRVTKQVVVHLESAGNASYTLAAAADRVLMPPLADWNVLGLHIEPTFLADTLAKVGVQLDVVRVAPWKTAYDRFSRAEMSEADREQTNRLLDGWFEYMVAAISQGRGLGKDQVRYLIDQSPLAAPAALAKGLIDGLAYEDELSEALGTGERQARLRPFAQARPYLKRKPRPTSSHRIGVITLAGTILTGKSRQFPASLPILGDSTIGSATVQQLVRAAAADESLDAVVLHIDSGGGSALASDLIWREISLLARKKPLVAYLGDIAASGGYYIALPAQKIICQPATLTGSIGVITAKLLTSDAYHKAAANRLSLRRGKNADIYADSRPWRGEQREKMEDAVETSYRAFKERVAAGRRLSLEQVDAVAGGRVWTGAQAVENGLVDSLGDFAAAVENACRLAGLPTDGSVALRPVEIGKPRMPLSAQDLGLTEKEIALSDLAELAFAVLGQDWSYLLGQDRVWLLADGLPRVRW